VAKAGRLLDELSITLDVYESAQRLIYIGNVSSAKMPKTVTVAILALTLWDNFFYFLKARLHWRSFLVKLPATLTDWSKQLL